MKETKLYSKEQLAELEAWFNAQKLPKELQLDKATFIPNVQDTVRRLLIQAKINVDNPKMQGCLLILERLQEKLKSLSVA